MQIGLTSDSYDKIVSVEIGNTPEEDNFLAELLQRLSVIDKSDAKMVITIHEDKKE